MQPITREEFKDYLMKNGQFSEIKADTIVRKTFRKAKDLGMNVFKQHAIEAVNPLKDMTNFAEVFFRKKKII